MLGLLHKSMSSLNKTMLGLLYKSMHVLIQYTNQGARPWEQNFNILKFKIKGF